MNWLLELHVKPGHPLALRFQTKRELFNFADGLDVPWHVGRVRPGLGRKWPKKRSVK